jgi:hypothetical protein
MAYIRYLDKNRGSLKLSELSKGLPGLRNTAVGTENQVLGQLTSILGRINESTTTNTNRVTGSPKVSLVARFVYCLWSSSSSLPFGLVELLNLHCIAFIWPLVCILQILSNWLSIVSLVTIYTAISAPFNRPIINS